MRSLRVSVQVVILVIVPLALQVCLLAWMSSLQSEAEAQLKVAEHAKLLADGITKLNAEQFAIEVAARAQCRQTLRPHCNLGVHGSGGVRQCGGARTPTVGEGYRGRGARHHAFSTVTFFEFATRNSGLSNFVMSEMNVTPDSKRGRFVLAV